MNVGSQQATAATASGPQPPRLAPSWCWSGYWAKLGAFAKSKTEIPAKKLRFTPLSAIKMERNDMKFSIRRVTAFAASSTILLALLCLTAAHAQDAGEPDTVEAKTPPITQVAGTWTGTYTGASSSGSLDLVLTQKSKNIGGTFSETPTSGNTKTGTVTGKISNDDLTLTFHQTTGHDCTIKILATVDPEATPPTMSGTFLKEKKGKHCNSKGTFDLTEE
jgi:hypothetical protein